MKRFLTAISLALIVAATTSAAEARRHHKRHHQAHHHVHKAPRHGQRAVVREHHEESSFGDIFQNSFSAGVGVVERARQFVGETAHQVGVRGTLWCSAFLRKVTGAQDVDDRALSWEKHQRIEPQVGAVVTMGRRGGGHVGVVSGFTTKGDPIVISGNQGGRVREAVYARSRIRAWVSPS